MFEFGNRPLPRKPEEYMPEGKALKGPEQMDTGKGKIDSAHVVDLLEGGAGLAARDGRVELAFSNKGTAVTAVFSPDQARAFGEALESVAAAAENPLTDRELAELIKNYGALGEHRVGAALRELQRLRATDA
jgi:hypothetical protein